MESLTTPDSKRYPAIVDLLVKARALYDTAGHRAEADAGITPLYARPTAAAPPSCRP